MGNFAFDRARGDTIKLLVTCTVPDDDGVQQPVNITSDTLYFTAKTDLALADGDSGVLQYYTGAGIEILSGPAGTAIVTIPPEATLGLTRNTTYKCDVERVEPNGVVTTVAEGIIRIHGDATRAV